MVLLSFFPQFRAMALGVLPNLVQGVIAAFGDFYTWKLAQKMYGAGSDAGSAAVGLYYLVLSREVRRWMLMVRV